MVSNNKLKAFTLVELAIVIVIIGLIVGGITAGQSIVKQIKLRSITTDMGTYEAAFNSFVLQYNGIPGDLTSAYDFWGNGGTVCTNADINTTSGGCNGNGDGKINKYVYLTTTTLHGEDLKAWQFLALSGFIPGNYAGTRGEGFVTGTNIPSSKYASTVGVSFIAPFYYSAWLSSGSFSAGTVPLNENNIAYFGIPMDSGARLSGPFLTTAEAYALDSKIDNGLPQNGKFIGYTGKPNSGSVTDHCASSSAASNFYVLTHNTVTCSVAYKMPK